MIPIEPKGGEREGGREGEKGSDREGGREGEREREGGRERERDRENSHREINTTNQLAKRVIIIPVHTHTHLC